MKQKIYVMYGFNLNDIDQTAYFGNNLNLVEDVELARRFSKTRGKSGTPQQWLELINSDHAINQGYRFHLVAVNH